MTVGPDFASRLVSTATIRSAPAARGMLPAMSRATLASFRAPHWGLVQPLRLHIRRE